MLAKARVEGQVLISADTDFGALLAFEQATTPSVLLIRRLADRRAGQQAKIILANLPSFEADLLSGAMVVLTEESIRIRPLPIIP